MRTGRADDDPQRSASRARQVVAIDRLPERLSMAEAGGAITINFEQESVVARLNDLTDGKGPEKCIDATGLESHVTFALPDTIYDRAKQMIGVESDRPHSVHARKRHEWRRYSDRSGISARLTRGARCRQSTRRP